MLGSAILGSTTGGRLGSTTGGKVGNTTGGRLGNTTGGRLGSTTGGRLGSTTLGSGSPGIEIETPGIKTDADTDTPRLDWVGTGPGRSDIDIVGIDRDGTESDGTDRDGVDKVGSDTLGTVGLGTDRTDTSVGNRIGRDGLVSAIDRALLGNERLVAKLEVWSSMPEELIGAEGEGVTDCTSLLGRKLLVIVTVMDTVGREVGQAIFKGKKH